MINHLSNGGGIMRCMYGAIKATVCEYTNVVARSAGFILDN